MRELALSDSFSLCGLQRGRATEVSNKENNKRKKLESSDDEEDGEEEEEDAVQHAKAKPTKAAAKRKNDKAGSTDHKNVKAGRLLGELVWASLPGYPWWPAELCECIEKDSIPPQVREVPADSRFVFFYGSNEVGFVKAWKPFNEHHLAAPPGGKKASRQANEAVMLARSRLEAIRRLKTKIGKPVAKGKAAAGTEETETETETEDEDEDATESEEEEAPVGKAAGKGAAKKNPNPKKKAAKKGLSKAAPSTKAALRQRRDTTSSSTAKGAGKASKAGSVPKPAPAGRPGGRERKPPEAFTYDHDWGPNDTGKEQTQDAD